MTARRWFSAMLLFWFVAAGSCGVSWYRLALERYDVATMATMAFALVMACGSQYCLDRYRGTK